MENASKALLMAGSVLMALILIGLLLLTFNRIGAYRASTAEVDKSSKIAAFNMEFEKYINDNQITGADIITLGNKIIDFNKKEGTLNYIDYDTTITLKLIKMNKFKEKYAYEGTNSFFTEDTYEIGSKDSTNSLDKKISEFNGVDYKLLKKLSSIYDPTNGNTKNESINKIKEQLLLEDKTKYKNWSATSTINPTLNQIINYKEYSEFKTSNFKCNKVEYDKNNAQVKYFEFEFDK